jgi:hypothetical protein
VRPRCVGAWATSRSEAVSNVIPLTCAFDALQQATEPVPLGGGMADDIVVVVAATIAALDLGARTLLRRRTSVRGSDPLTAARP